jgi:hypothetical protein
MSTRNEMYLVLIVLSLSALVFCKNNEIPLDDYMTREMAMSSSEYDDLISHPYAKSMPPKDFDINAYYAEKGIDV